MEIPIGLYINGEVVFRKRSKQPAGGRFTSSFRTALLLEIEGKGTQSAALLDE